MLTAITARKKLQKLTSQETSKKFKKLFSFTRHKNKNTLHHIDTSKFDKNDRKVKFLSYDKKIGNTYIVLNPANDILMKAQ